MRREQQQPGGGRAGAPDHQQVPVCEPERGGDALGHLHDQGEGMRPLAAGASNVQPPSGRSRAASASMVAVKAASCAGSSGG
jgi:hypothetical protein